MNEAHQILNKGFLRLVDSMGDDLSVVRNARVSYDAAWRAGDDAGSDARLINYLMTNGHNTPFESVTATFEVKAPIFVLRQSTYICVAPMAAPSHTVV
jgi:thymidylate synthase (FAD)